MDQPANSLKSYSRTPRRPVPEQRGPPFCSKGWGKLQGALGDDAEPSILSGLVTQGGLWTPPGGLRALPAAGWEGSGVSSLGRLWGTRCTGRSLGLGGL